MDIEVWLDCDDLPPDRQADIRSRFEQWFRDGSHLRPDKKSFASMRALSKPHHYLVDLGYADPTSALRDLHARVNRLGAKLFVHYFY